MEPAENVPKEPEDVDPVEDPRLLLRAEARVAGRSLRQWRRLINKSLPALLGPYAGIALLAAVILLWMWITSAR